jgi:hypothetical protein
MNTHSILKRLMFCMIFLLPVTLSANTVVFGGYIATVSVDIDPKQRVGPYIDVMRTWDGRIMTMHIDVWKLLPGVPVSLMARNSTRGISLRP